MTEQLILTPYGQSLVDADTKILQRVNEVLSATTIRFIVFGDPKGQPRMRHSIRCKKGCKPFVHGYTPSVADDWRHAISDAVRPLLHGLTAAQRAGAIEIQATFWFSRPKADFGSRKGERYLKPISPKHHLTKPDADNVCKALEDELVAVRNDAPDVCVKADLVAVGAFNDDRQVVHLDIWKRWTTRDDNRAWSEIAITYLDSVTP